MTRSSCRSLVPRLRPRALGVQHVMGAGGPNMVWAPQVRHGGEGTSGARKVVVGKCFRSVMPGKYLGLAKTVWAYVPYAYVIRYIPYALEPGLSVRVCRRRMPVREAPSLPWSVWPDQRLIRRPLSSAIHRDCLERVHVLELSANFMRVCQILARIWALYGS
jgi:hypothetical protein